MIKKLFFTAIFCLWSFVSNAVCLGLSIENVASTITYVGAGGEYNSFDTAEYIQTVTFEVRGSTSVLCSYFVDLTTGSSGNATQRTMTGSSTALNYNAYTTSNKANIFRDVNSASSTSQVITGSIPTLSSNYVGYHSFYWTIPAGQIRQATAARYQDTVSLRVFNGVLGLIFVPTHSRSVTLQTKIESSVDLSLVDTGSSFAINDTVQTMDFGTLTTGKQRSFDLIVRTNDGYSLNMQSVNSQRLRHSYYPTISSTIPYTLMVSGATKDLSTGGIVNVGTTSSLSTASGIVLPVQATIGTVATNQAGGTYTDYITVTVTAD